jgi:hypothetical protein
MRPRRNSRGGGMMQAQDPGKDLFAYLFLLIMVFAFMLLMSVDQQKQTQTAPEHAQPGRSGFHKVSADHVATLEKNKEKLWLRFGDVRYDPLTDFEKLVQDGRLIKDGDGEKQMLLIEDTPGERIFLHDYLETFSVFSRQGVAIAFAKEVL